MGKKIIQIIVLLFVTACNTSGLLLVGVTKELKLCNNNDGMIKGQEFWNDYKRSINDSSGWVNPTVFRKYRFGDSDSILSWGNSIDVSYVKKQNFHIGKADVTIIEFSYGYGEWSPFFMVFKKNDTGWQLWTAKLFSPYYWNKIVIEQDDNKDVFKFIVEGKIVDWLIITKSAPL